MSKEMDLLKRISATGWLNHDLSCEVEQLLAQPEQEPVAWMNDSGGCFLSDGNKYSENWTALYTSPPKREPLGEEESYHEAKRLYEAEDGLWYADGFVDGLKFAEKMHGITGGGE